MFRVRPIDVCQGLLIGLLAAGIAQAAAPMSAAKGKYFSGSGVCAPCHTNLKDEAGRDVSIDKAWRATMIGNSARDPFWSMVIRTEVLVNPGLRATIEDKCSTCHMPMARTTAAAEGGKGAVLDQGFADPAHALHEQAALDSLGRLAFLSVAVKVLQQQLGLAIPDGDSGPRTCVALHTLQKNLPGSTGSDGTLTPELHDAQRWQFPASIGV